MNRLFRTVDTRFTTADELQKAEEADDPPWRSRDDASGCALMEASMTGCGTAWRWVLWIPSGTGVTPAIQSGGVLSASAFGGLHRLRQEHGGINGSNLTVDMRRWAGTDSMALARPTSLDGTIVAIGAQKPTSVIF